MLDVGFITGCDLDGLEVGFCPCWVGIEVQELVMLLAGRHYDT